MFNNGYMSRNYWTVYVVPQGKPGPLLFLLYIDEILILISCPALEYADELNLNSTKTGLAD